MGTMTLSYEWLWLRLITMPDYSWRIKKHTYIQFVLDDSGQVAKNENGIPLPNLDIGLLYYETYNVVYKANGDIVLHGGWRRRTTTDRINMGLPPDATVIWLDGGWHIRTPKGVYPFDDGMTIHPDGSIEYVDGHYGSRKNDEVVNHTR